MKCSDPDESGLLGFKLINVTPLRLTVARVKCMAYASYFVAVTRYLTRSNLKKQRFIFRTIAHHNKVDMAVGIR